MKRSALTVMALGALLWASGCYHVTYTTGKPQASSTRNTEGTNHFFIGGLISGSQEAMNRDLTSACEQGVAKVHLYKTFGDGFLQMLTLGIYTPRSYEVWCAAKGSSDKKASTELKNRTNLTLANSQTGENEP